MSPSSQSVPDPCRQPHRGEAGGGSLRHLVAPIVEKSIPEVVALLTEAHDDLVARASEASSTLRFAPTNRWGIQAKRTGVELAGERPSVVTKASERFAEVMNSEFAHALANPKRAWSRLVYWYSRFLADSDHATMLLEVVPVDVLPS